MKIKAFKVFTKYNGRLHSLCTCKGNAGRIVDATKPPRTRSSSFHYKYRSGQMAFNQNVNGAGLFVFVTLLDAMDFCRNGNVCYEVWYDTKDVISKGECVVLVEKLKVSKTRVHP